MSIKKYLYQQLSQSSTLHTHLMYDKLCSYDKHQTISRDKLRGHINELLKMQQSNPGFVI